VPDDPIENARPIEHIASWYVEVLKSNGWRPLRRRLGGIAHYALYQDAVAAAVQEWQRTDRPARPAPATGHGGPESVHQTRD
jgi:hypothetical protein